MHHIDDNNCWRWLTMLMQTMSLLASRIALKSQTPTRDGTPQYHSNIIRPLENKYRRISQRSWVMSEVGISSYPRWCCLLLLRDWRSEVKMLLSNGSCDPSRQKVKENLTEASKIIWIPMCLQPTMDEKRPNLNEFIFASKLGTEFQCRLHASLT